MSCNVTVVWMAWETPPSHTAVRDGASSSLMVQPVSMPLWNAALSWRTSKLRWSMTPSYWLAVRVGDEGWMLYWAVILLVRKWPHSNFLNYLAGEDNFESYDENKDIAIRSQFPESWLWTFIELPGCSRPNWWGNQISHIHSKIHWETIPVSCLRLSTWVFHHSHIVIIYKFKQQLEGLKCRHAHKGVGWREIYGRQWWETDNKWLDWWKCYYLMVNSVKQAGVSSVELLRDKRAYSLI